MEETSWLAPRPLTEEQMHAAREDLVLIARGDERDLPWHRLRLLLDHDLAEISYPVFTQGSVRSLKMTDKGYRFVTAEPAIETIGPIESYEHPGTVEVRADRADASGYRE